MFREVDLLFTTGMLEYIHVRGKISYLVNFFCFALLTSLPLAPPSTAVKTLSADWPLLCGVAGGDSSTVESSEIWNSTRRLFPSTDPFRWLVFSAVPFAGEGLVLSGGGIALLLSFPGGADIVGG